MTPAGRNFITVRGFTMRHAATPWAPPTAEQVGLIGTHWSKGWIIENNRISHSISTGVTLGKHGDEFDNTSANSAGGYVKTVERAQAFDIPWTKEHIGHHIVRNNHISHCEQAGIAGSLGAIFSTITGNTIHDIHVRRMVAGEEMAGIKLHAAIDTLISRNHIFRTNRGIWLDWMAQGARVTGNLLHANASAEVDWPGHWEARVSGGEQDLFLEVNHGPILVDHNILLSPYSVNNRSQGVAFVHNLFAGVFRNVQHDERMTPFHKPHSTEVVALHNHPMGDTRFYNNMFVQHPDLSGFDVAKSPVSMAGNVYINGARPSKHEADPLVLNAVDLTLRIEQMAHDWILTFAGASAWREAAKTRMVTTESLGHALVPGQPFANQDGSPYRLDRDYFGKKRNETNPFPGPFEIESNGRQRWKVSP
jgi:alpha-L-arabinofuranosidase